MEVDNSSCKGIQVKKTTLAGVQGVGHCSQKGAELLIFFGKHSIGEFEPAFSHVQMY